MRSNRNTLLLISGIMQIVKSCLACVMLMGVSASLGVIDSWLRIKIFNSALYLYSPESAEKLAIIIIVLIFVLLGFSIVFNAISGMMCFDQSKLGVEPLSRKNALIVLACINFILSLSPVASVLTIVAMLVDKSQPDITEKAKIEKEAERLKIRIEEVKKLKEDKAISKQEFLDILTKILVEDE